MRPVRRALVVTGAIGVAAVVGVLVAPAASAHPLGNATVNHYDGLTLHPDHITDLSVIDTAEIPTLQRAPLIDTDGDGRISPPEAARYAAIRCGDLAAAVMITVDAARLPLTAGTATYVQTPGAAGLDVGRLECALTATADLTRPVTVDVDDPFDSAGIGGWHEITAVGSGVVLQDSPVPATSVSDALHHYPNDLLSSPLDVRSATLSATPGAGTSTYGPVAALPGADVAVRLLNDLSTAFDDLVGRKDLSAGVVALAVLLSLALGAGHAFLPGHGKTIMAAYLVGRRGRLRDVVTVGATVTVTHTAGVLVLGLVLSASTVLAPTAVLQVLAVVSGVLVAGVGVGLLASALRRRREAGAIAVLGDELRTPIAVGVTAGPGSPLDTGHGHGHGGHGHGHGHGHAHGHGHGREDGAGRFGRGGLLGLGVAGGLVPSPSALLVLLAAVALGRTWFGIVLVLGYGVGMAVALSTAGLLLVRLQSRILTVLARPRAVRAARRVDAVLAALPVLTALLVVVVGAGLVLRALSGSV